MADKDIIFVVEVYLDDGSVLKMGTDNLTVGSDTYNGNIMTKFSLSNVSKTIDIIDGGKFGGNCSLTFNIPKDNSDSITSDYFDSFYPATGQPLLDAATVYFGWGYSGISAIEWEHELYVSDITYNFDNMQVTCYEISDLELVSLPFYTVKKASDDTTDVFGEYPYMDSDNDGILIPIIYGKFGGTYSLYNSINKNLSGATPLILTNISTGQFIVASHSIGTEFMPDDTEFFIYLDGHKTYQHITVIQDRSTRTRIDGVNTNDDGLSMFQLITDSAEGFAVGELNLMLDNTKFDTPYKVRNVLNPHTGDGDSSYYDDVTALEDPIYLSSSTALTSDTVGEAYKSTADTHIAVNVKNTTTGGVTFNSYLVSSGDPLPYTTVNGTSYRISQSLPIGTLTKVTIPCYAWHPTTSSDGEYLSSPSSVFKYTLYINMTGSSTETSRLYNAYLHMGYMDVNIKTVKNYTKVYFNVSESYYT